MDQLQKVQDAFRNLRVNSCPAPYADQADGYRRTGYLPI